MTDCSVCYDKMGDQSNPTINSTSDKLITTDADEEIIFLFNDLFLPRPI